MSTIGRFKVTWREWGWGGIPLKLDIQGQGGGRILDVDGQEGEGVENWIIFMEVIYV